MGDPNDSGSDPNILGWEMDNAGDWNEDGPVAWGDSYADLWFDGISAGTIWQEGIVEVGIQYLITIDILLLLPVPPVATGVFVSCDEVHSANNVLFETTGQHQAYITPLVGNKNQFSIWTKIGTDAGIIASCNIQKVANVVAFEYNLMPGDDGYKEDFEADAADSMHRIARVEDGSNCLFLFTA